MSSSVLDEIVEISANAIHTNTKFPLISLGNGAKLRETKNKNRLYMQINLVKQILNLEK